MSSNVTRLKMRWLGASLGAGFLFLVLLTLLLAAVSGWYQAYTLRSQLLLVVDAQESAKIREYYRGLYDSCLVMLGSVETCNEAVRITLQHEWYRQPSEGFEWPLDPSRAVK